jgi:probable rRNA maturation factor
METELTEMVNEICEEYFDLNEVTKQVIEMVIDSENCPYEVQVNILMTDNEGIRQINRDALKKDKPTDVLSFPAIDFKRAADFTGIDDDISCFDPDSGELLLGDIMISADKLREQAVNYGHSLKREYAFLLVHSLLHLIGYGHLEAGEAEIMEEKQESVLTQLGIGR